MAWTVPMTWTNGLLVTNTHLNTHVRDNLNALKNPPTATVQPATLTPATTSTSFVTVQGTFFNHSLTTAANAAVLCAFQGVITSSTNATVSFTLEVDGSYVSGASTHGVWKFVNVGTGGAGVSLIWLVQGLSAAAHTFELFWKTSAGTLTLEPYTNMYWVREIS